MVKIETEKYDAKPTYKKFLGYRPGVYVIGDKIVYIENSILSVFYLTAASLLVNRAEYMEKLAYAFGFAFSGNGVSLYKSHTHES